MINLIFNSVRKQKNLSLYSLEYKTSTQTVLEYIVRAKLCHTPKGNSEENESQNKQEDTKIDLLLKETGQKGKERTLFQVKKESSISPGLMERSCVAMESQCSQNEVGKLRSCRKSFRKKIKWSQVTENPEYLPLESKLNQGQREPWKAGV